MEHYLRLCIEVVHTRGGTYYKIHNLVCIRSELSISTVVPLNYIIA